MLTANPELQAQPVGPQPTAPPPPPYGPQPTAPPLYGPQPIVALSMTIR